MLYHRQAPCNVYDFQDETVPYAFFVDNIEITENLEKCLDNRNFNAEHVLDIIYQEQAVFKVRPITRCTRLVKQIWFACELIYRL